MTQANYPDSIQRFESYSGYREAFLDIVARAQHKLIMLDFDFHESDLGCKRMYDLLWAFFTQASPGTLQLLSFDDEYLGRHCPRFLQLRERFAHRIELRCTKETQGWQQGFVLTDNGHYLLRHHFDWPKGEIGQNTLISAGLQHKFSELWEHGQPPQALHSLNI